MPNVLAVANSSRSKCRGCGRTISKGELRFGESLPNPYREGEALHWFHPVCAACMRPESFLPVLDASDAELEQRAWLRGAAEEGVAHSRLPRVARTERARSGRARCRLCRELMEKEKFRLVLQMFEDGRMAPIGSIHLECAEAYLGTAALLERIVRLTPDLEPSDRSEIEAALAQQRPAPPEAEATSAEAEAANGVDPIAASAAPENAGPALKKTLPPPDPRVAKPRRA